MEDCGAELFDTDWGPCGMAWNSKAICSIVLPGEDDDKTLGRLTHALNISGATRKPAFVSHAQRQIRNYLSTRPHSLKSIPIDLSSASLFARDVYLALRKVGRGKTVTYSSLAEMAGHRGAARAVGRAMACNPLPLLVPCHRVLAAGRKLGGFSAHGGAETKARLLYLEGVVLNPEHHRGMRLVRRREPALGKIMSRVGPYSPTLGSTKRPYDALVESIIYQQLSMKAAATIASRVRALGKDGRYPDGQMLAHISDGRLRHCGLSRQKISYLRDLAGRVSDGRLNLRRLGRMGDEEVLDTLREVRGFGTWSAQMFLIFHLGRLDVWPVGDLGLRRAIATLTGLDTSDVQVLESYGESFRPYRSIATWYLWRYVDVGGLA